MSTRIGVCWVVFSLLALTTPAARAADEAAIRRAVGRGVDYLKQSQTKEGLWTRQAGGTMGATALAGLALLECGLTADDPPIQKAAEALRDGSISLTDTYSISLGIMFFDRLGYAGDVPLIESLMVRLLAGQTADGGWTYECAALSEAEANRLKDLIKRKAGDRNKEAAEKKRTVRDLPREIQQQLSLAEQLGPAAGGVAGSDNSNTQFATLALWIGHRHGMPVGKALTRLETRFRRTQNADGGWGYNAGSSSGTTPAMICAGLLGLAVADGFANETISGANKVDKETRDQGAGTARESSRPQKPRIPRDPARDRSVRAGLLALGAVIGHPIGLRQPLALVDGGPKQGATAGFLNYYFLWSLERVAVIFGLQTIGNKDWYGWGADYALTQQRGDGSWSGDYSEGGVDTSFALLFLRRSNLVQDLTTSLRGKVQDPGEVALRAGGVGGDLAKRNTTPEPAKESDTTGSGLPKLIRPDRIVRPDGRPTDPEAARLSAEFVRAAPAQRDTLLEKLKEGKGLVHTQALAAAIPQLTGPSKTKARDALAERISRMTASTLKDKLQDADLEIRRAAALASALKEEKKLIPDLIRSLEDPEPPVIRAGHVALKALTGQDFGPAPEASRAERAKAVAAWKSWWTKQGGSLIAAEPPLDGLTDQERLQGTWVLTGLERDGKALPKAKLANLHVKLIFKGDNVTFEYPDHTELGTYILEDTNNPGTIDVVTELDTSKGIYRLEADSLKICGVPTGEERPVEFTTKPGTKQVLFVLKRQKP